MVHKSFLNQNFKQSYEYIVQAAFWHKINVFF